jgi:hypothetical protein
MARPLELDELVEHWTLLDDERELVAGKRGATRLGFSLLLKFYTRHGRFPRGRAELAGETVDFVARQVGVPPEELGLYEWTGRTTEYHRAQIRQHLGFQECSTADADKLTAWLTDRGPGPAGAGRRRAVAVDGKTLRGARTGTANGRPAHLLACMDHTTRAVLAQRQVGGAPEEVTAFAPLLAHSSWTARSSPPTRCRPTRRPPSSW